MKHKTYVSVLIVMLVWLAYPVEAVHRLNWIGKPNEHNNQHAYIGFVFHRSIGCSIVFFIQDAEN